MERVICKTILSMKMKEVLQQLEQITKEVLNKKFKKLNELIIPKEQGIYIIKEKNKRFFGDNKVFYIGNSKNLYKRIISQHSSKSNAISGSMLRIKFNRDHKLDFDKINDYLMNNCLFVTHTIEDYDMTEIIESVFIKHYRDEGRDEGFDLMNKHSKFYNKKDKS